MRNKTQHIMRLAPSLKISLSLIFIFAVAAVTLAQSQPQTSGATSTWRNTPATPERTKRNIEEAAVKFQANAPIPRAVLYDIGFPHNEQEYVALDGHAVFLLTVLSHERDELPLKRAYVIVDGKEINLKHIKSVLSEQSDSDSQVAKTFGAYRADELYLLPIYLRLKPADVLVDFAKNKDGFKIATFGTEVSADVARLPIKAPTGAGPSDKVLEEFIKREYPGFF